MDEGIGAMITYNMQTYSPDMAPGSVVPPSAFGPNRTAIADAWLAAAAAFGAKYAVLTTDHFSGFNLWPSTAWAGRKPPYTTAQSGWSDGQDGTDLVAQFARVFRQGGLRAGIFYSVHNNWAWNVSDFVARGPSSQAEYNSFVLEQLAELLGGHYGDWDELWFDAGVHNTINPGVGPLVQKLAPKAICHSCNGFAGSNGIRWVGNEYGEAPLPNWMSVESEDACAGQPSGGAPNGTVFCPPSCDTVLGTSPSWHFWFWREHTAADLKSVDALVSTFLASVGRSCNLILNLAPSRTGELPAGDMERYAAMGSAIAALTAHPVANASSVPLAVETRPWRHVNGSVNLTASLPIARPVEVKNVTVVVREDLTGQGQRVAAHEVWLLAGSGEAEPTWLRLASSSTIGSQRFYVPGAADDVSEGSVSAVSLRNAQWPLVLHKVQVRVTAIPAGFEAPSSLRSIEVYSVW